MLNNFKAVYPTRIFYIISVIKSNNIIFPCVIMCSFYHANSIIFENVLVLSIDFIACRNICCNRCKNIHNTQI